MQVRPRAKIIFFLPTLEAGGGELITLNLIKNLNKEHFQPTLLLRKIKGGFKDRVPNNVLISELKSSNLFFIFFKLIKYFRLNSSDIFISCFTYTNIVTIAAKVFSRSKTKLIVAEHTTFSQIVADTENIFRKLLAYFVTPYLIKLTYPKAEAIVCVSRGVAEDLSKIIGHSKKIKVIYNPVVSDQLYKLAKEPVSHSWFLDHKIPIILAVGRLIKAKDYPTLLRAFSLISQKELLHLVILGKGEERKNLETLAQKLGISKNIAFLGFQENPYKYMAKASIFVLSSSREGFPSALVEAMACGIPVISTNCQSGPNEIIENGKNGFLVPVGDEKSLAEAILKLLNNPSLRKKFSEEGKKRARDFSVEKSINEYEKLFQEIINQN